MGRKKINRTGGVCLALGLTDIPCQGQIEAEHVVPSSKGGCWCHLNIAGLCTLHHRLRHIMQEDTFYDLNGILKAVWVEAQNHHKTCPKAHQHWDDQERDFLQRRVKQTVHHGESLGNAIGLALKAKIEKAFEGLE